DVVIVDEAHLLLTQGQQSYQGKNNLDDLLQRAKVVVIVLYLKQVLTTGQIWEEEHLEKYYNQSENINKLVILINQI
ncbi:DNA/RNA helicase domain-containing protein, partial [Staphylococcus haemolyticus]|uniref:DNA/RNA helicase domain-containing protein n=1 Tax=Staphylococcus haemolyticus TaxID=1283 RepID=UPI003B7B5FC1